VGKVGGFRVPIDAAHLDTRVAVAGYVGVVVDAGDSARPVAHVVSAIAWYLTGNGSSRGHVFYDARTIHTLVLLALGGGTAVGIQGAIRCWRLAA
jgi:hypothetical protein